MADHSKSDLIRAFARDKGLARRSAQWNAKNETDKWKAWLAVQRGVAASVVEFALEDPVAPPVPERRGRRVAAAADVGPVGDPERIERAHWDLWVAAVEAAKREQDGLMRAALLRSVNEARKAYADARRARIQAQIESRELVPAREFAEFLDQVRVVAAMVPKAFSDIASEGNPENPVQVIRAGAKWVEHKWNPAIEELASAA